MPRLMEHHLTHVQLGVHQILSGIPMQSLGAPSPHSSSSLMLCPTSSSCASVALNSISLFDSARTLFSDGVPVLYRGAENASAESWSDHGTHLIRFPSSEIIELHCMIQCRKTVISYILSGFMVVYNGRINAV